MKDIYYNIETGKTHVRWKKKWHGCGRSGWFAGHHGSTHSAWKPPCEKWPDGRSHENQAYRKRHNRKSRYWFRDEIRKLLRDEKSKL